jgi:hypothetical protein
MGLVNKAFCREPDATAPPRCPGCGAIGVAVAAETLAAHALAPEAVSEPAYFCGTEACGVAYYDLFERSIPVGDARDLFWPKDPQGTLCGCLGLTADGVDNAIDSGDLSAVRQVVQASTLPDAGCGIRSCDGRPCAARVQRYFVRRRQEIGG